MLKVVCWKWKPFAGYRSTFTAEHVNTFASMVQRHFHAPHEIVCITDDGIGIDPSIRVVDLWDDCSEIPAPLGFPSCYRRLKAFSPEMRDIIGERFISVDLDVVITGDITGLWSRPDDFVIWGHCFRNSFYNGSMWMMNAGCRRQVWDTFHKVESPRVTKNSGTDQAWISHILGNVETTWTDMDGVYAFRTIRTSTLPKNSKIVFFQGRVDPWSDEAQSLCWVKDNYR